jgi:hypothetical protein
MRIAGSSPILQWMHDILQPYLKKTIAELGLDENQKSLLILDCYLVHTSKSFWLYVLKEFPNIFLSCIPANCE